MSNAGRLAYRARSLAGSVLFLGAVVFASLQGCATTPAVMDTGDPIPLRSTDPRYSGYLGRISKMIKEKWGYPCVEDEATGRCEYRPARLKIEFGLLQDGRVDYVTVIAKAKWEIYDEYAVDAIRRASPFPPVPPALMSQAKPGSAVVRIVAAIEYKIVDSNLPR